MAEASADDKKPPIVFSQADEDAFMRKWSGPLILGPLMPAIFAVIVVVAGGIVLQTSDGGSCNETGYLKSAVSANLLAGYLFLLVYTWVFFGDTFIFTMPITGEKYTVLKPLTSLRYLAAIYIFLTIFSIITMAVLCYFLAAASYCVTSIPILYSFCYAIAVLYWVGFFIILAYTIKLNCGEAIKSKIVETRRPPTEKELEEQIFRKLFKTIDKRKQGKIPKDSLPKFLQALGIYIPEEEIPELVQMLDQDDTGDIGFYPLFNWFKAFEAAANTHEQNQLHNVNANNNNNDGGATRASINGGTTRASINGGTSTNNNNNLPTTNKQNNKNQLSEDEDD